MLDDNDANEIGDGGASDAEGEAYECVVSFKDGMKEVELERLCSDANESESGVEVDNNDGFVCVCVFLASGYEWVTVMHEIPISSAPINDILPYPRIQ